jgi:hypothetical protein
MSTGKIPEGSQGAALCGRSYVAGTLLAAACHLITNGIPFCPITEFSGGKELDDG